MNQPLSRPSTAARADGARGTRPATARAPYRPAGAPTFSQALTSAAQQTRVGGQAAGQVGNPTAGRGAARPVADSLLRPSSSGLMGAAGIVDPMGLNATSSMATLAALSATQRPVAFPSTGARTEGVAPQGVAATRPGSPQAPSKARIDDFMRSIKGFDQTKASEYDSAAQARTWGYSTCSAAALTAVLRAAGKDVKISDVMREMPNGMTVDLGLVSRPALVNAANAFGAQATDDVTSYEKLRAATEAGQPVLVDYRDAKFPQGHFVVVTGVTEEGVRVADSSRYDLTFIPRGEFMRSWSGKGIRVDGLVPASRPNPGQPAPTQPAPTQPAPSQPGAPTIKTA